MLHVKTNSLGVALKGTANSIKICDDASHTVLKISFALQASWDSHYDDDDDDNDDDGSYEYEDG